MRVTLHKSFLFTYESYCGLQMCYNIISHMFSKYYIILPLIISVKQINVGYTLVLLCTNIFMHNKTNIYAIKMAKSVMLIT